MATWDAVRQHHVTFLICLFQNCYHSTRSQCIFVNPLQHSWTWSIVAICPHGLLRHRLVIYCHIHLILIHKCLCSEQQGCMLVHQCFRMLGCNASRVNCMLLGHVLRPYTKGLIEQSQDCYDDSPLSWSLQWTGQHSCWVTTTPHAQLLHECSGWLSRKRSCPFCCNTTVVIIQPADCMWWVSLSQQMSRTVALDDSSWIAKRNGVFSQHIATEGSRSVCTSGSKPKMYHANLR